jgi:hypothetical protein
VCSIAYNLANNYDADPLSEEHVDTRGGGEL